MEVFRKTLFESPLLHIGRFEARPTSDACGDVESQSANVMVLPVSGLFAKHDAPGRNVIGTPSHAVLITADTPYRLSFPGAIGDRALILRFGHGVASDHRDCQDNSDDVGPQGLASHALLSPRAMLLRNLLWRRLVGAQADMFEAEALGIDLLAMSLHSLRAVSVPPRRSAQIRWRRAIARVKEAVALAPADDWTVARLAKIAHLSPFHLCHVFRRMTGTSVYDYVLQERLACALDAVLDGGDDLTAIALDAGFASHSHFTAHFRKFFGCTPTALRRAATGSRVAELRKIATAQRYYLA